MTVHRPHRAHLPAPEAAPYQSIVVRMGTSRHIDSFFLGSLSGAFTDFAHALDELALQRGWLQTRPGVVIRNWRILAGLELGTGLIFFGWLSRLFGASTELRDIDFVELGVGAAIAGVITYFVSGVMPARTKEVAGLAAMLNAYRRTLEATIAQAQSLEQVVVMRPPPWVGTPTEEIAWAVAFNLDRQIDSLLSQSLEVPPSWRLADGHPRLVLDHLEKSGAPGGIGTHSTSLRDRGRAGAGRGSSGRLTRTLTGTERGHGWSGARGLERAQIGRAHV